MNRIQTFLALVILLVIFPVSVSAETVLRVGDAISVESDQVVEGDYYVSVGPVGNTTMSGSVTEDMYAFGGVVTVNGSVGNDLTIVSGASQLHASVTDDVRIISGEVTIAEHVGGDVFVIGGSLKVLSTASVGGDILFFGGSAEINGPVAGSVQGNAQSIRIDSAIGGDIDVTASAGLVLGSRASIVGDVRFVSTQPLSRAQGAVIEGEIVSHDYGVKDARAKTQDVIVPIFITLFATLSLYLLFRKELQLLVDRIFETYGVCGLVGLGVIILGPIASILLMVTVLGILIGVLSFAGVLILYIAGYALSSVVLGAGISLLLTKKKEVTLVWVVVGTIGLQAVSLVPVVGPLFLFIVFSLTVGGISISAYKTLL